MTSRLARALLPVPRRSGPVGDMLWRYTDPATVASAGCTPSDDLLQELFLVGAPAQLEAVGRHTPSGALLRSVAPTAPQAFRLGAASNPAAPDDLLSVLSADSDDTVRVAASALADRRAELLAVVAHDEQAASAAVVEEVDVAVELLLDLDVTRLVRALLAHRDLDAWMLSIQARNPGLHDRVMLEWVSDPEAPLTRHPAAWLARSPSRAQTLMGLSSPSALRRRCTPAALQRLETEGLLVSSVPGSATATPLDSLAAALSPVELSGMIVGSQAPVSREVLQRSLHAAAPSLAVNFLTGSCLRKPAPGDVAALVDAAPRPVRLAWSEAFAQPTSSPDMLGSLPWAGELLLIASMDLLEHLGAAAASDLDAAVTARLGDHAAAWEFASVLAEEWNGPLVDLLDAAVAMESPQA